MSDKKILVGDMSRETAIGILKLMLEAMEVYDSIAPTPQRRNAIQMAISSLETDEAYDLEYEQPEFCKDCISREEVYYYISSHINEIITESGTDKNAHTNAILRSLANGVKLMPRVLPDVHDNNVGNIDCISRADAIGSIAVECSAEKLDIDYAKFLMLRRAIKALPTVTPIRLKGHWIGHREHCENLGVMPSGLGAYEWCSNCDCGIDVVEWHRNHYNYCPNCGAYMEKVVEE